MATTNPPRRSLPVAPSACCTPVGSEAFDESAATELAAGFQALADPVRLRLLSMIVGAGDQGACVCDLVEPSGRSQPTVSHHLRILREAGLVASERRGTWAWYTARPDRLDDLRRVLGRPVVPTRRSQPRAHN